MNGEQSAPGRAAPGHAAPARHSLGVLLDNWRDQLGAWAIPDRISHAVTESPWVLPRQVFARRADRLAAAPQGPSYWRAWSALDPPGSVLDVGVGAGAACIPLLPRTTALTAVDTDQEMLEVSLADDLLAWELDPDGVWRKVPTVEGIDAQRRMYELSLMRSRRGPDRD